MNAEPSIWKPSHLNTCARILASLSFSKTTVSLGNRRWGPVAVTVVKVHRKNSKVEKTHMGVFEACMVPLGNMRWGGGLDGDEDAEGTTGVLDSSHGSVQGMQNTM